jgi:flagellar basal body-associated protein FliL
MIIITIIIVVMVVVVRVTIILWLRASDLFPNIIYSQTVNPQTRTRQRCHYYTATFINNSGSGGTAVPPLPELLINHYCCS